MTMHEYSEATLEEAANLVNLVGTEPFAAVDLCRFFWRKISTAAISRRLNALYREGFLDRRRDGNRRYWRWMYFVRE